ncbi:Rab-GTPase-TBC domain [Macleaya cordata]|uniref:Rab-GTPase-TBC domain n=1 Tax=Macleaya cordata TaxID=56857 RepID=A0A200R6A4_MACCD|nr:Rab-GTPase-TBC domain [Macleaya cordata]
MKAKSLPLLTFEHKRDAYGFSVRPQHLQRYREYANIYKEEEEERSERWKDFLERQAESAQLPINGLPKEEDTTSSHADETVPEAETVSEKGVEEDDSNGVSSVCDGSTEEEVAAEKETKAHVVQIWAQIRPSLGAIEHMMSIRLKKRKNLLKDEQDTRSGSHLAPIEESKSSKGTSEEDSDDEFYDVERSDPVQDAPSTDNTNAPGDSVNAEPFFPWKEELECLVHGGVPMALRGELWQAFVGAKARRVESYYQDLLARETNVGKDKEPDGSLSDNTDKGSSADRACAPEKWKGQIEKDLPRTFPGHPALDEDGRNALRRLLTAYARHNPSVGYCQAMNFFAGLLLLLMPEENAFWTLMGIIDDYFDGYFSEEMIESQVDQLVFEELVRERFPKLVNHLDYLGVQVAWVTGPWFLSIFVNMLPWESVLRVWDVLLFEGNRIMLFRTALAIMELYGPALVTTKDAGDAVTLLQSLAGSTFDSSQLVLTACMGFQSVNEARLQELRDKHRPSVVAAVEERAKGLRVWKDSQGLASKFYSFKHDPKSLITETNTTEGLGDIQTNGGLESGATNLDDFLSSSLTGDSAADSVPDLQEQVVWLKVELCKLLEEKRSAILRAEELETALMEMVKQDNRRQLSARVEMLEQEVAELRQSLADKQEQERAMLQVLMRVEQDQKVTEDARRFAEQDAAAQRYAANVLQEKYEEAMASLAQMEKRAVMAESMLEATLQYQSGQVKAQQSPRSVQPESSPVRVNQESTQEPPPRKISLLSRPFGLGWRGDRNKGKPTPVEESNDSKPSIDEGPGVPTQQNDANSDQDQEK